jgi:CBS domain-containing protein
MKVRNVMTKQPTCCTPDTSLEAVARLMVDCDCGIIPVVGDLAGKFPIGVITDRDIVTRSLAGGKNPLELTARDCMTMPAITVTEDTSLQDCCDLLEINQIRRVLVVDRDGRMSGVVAQADVAAHGSKRLAGELVREVSQPTRARAFAH